jgi:micrococcal nuclease
LYDADTLYIDIDLGFGIWMRGRANLLDTGRIKIQGLSTRSYGINAPEMRGSESQAGHAAKAYAAALLPPEGHMLYLHSVKDKSGKFGRWLFEIFFKDVDNKWKNLNKLLVDAGHAEIVEY